MKIWTELKAVSYVLLNRAFLFTKKKLQCLTLAENTKTTVVFHSEDAVLYEKKSMYIVWHYTFIHLVYFYCILAFPAVVLEKMVEGGNSFSEVSLNPLWTYLELPENSPFSTKDSYIWLELDSVKSPVVVCYYDQA